MSTTEPIFVQQPKDSRRRGSALSIVALILSLTAVGLAAWAALRPAHPVASDFTGAQRADAKTAICAAADLVRKGVSVNTNLQSPGGSGDVTGSLAVAANARQALSGGGLYLVARLDPATPAEVSDAVTAFARTLMDIGAASTAGAQNTDPDQAARLRDADTQNAKLARVCQ
jgi:hypothetical protein